MRNNTKSIARLNYDNAQLALINRTYARDCNNDEFDLFMQTCAHRGLDPFKKEIYAQVFNKGNKDKRNLVIVVGIDGLRKIAEDSGRYRPDDREPIYTYSDALKSTSNPLGIERVSVTVYKQDSKGQWFPINGVAYWDEFVPLKEEWEYDSSAGKKLPSGKFELSANWKRMPRLMIAKCAEAQALRKGWSASGLYAEEELDRAALKDVTASQAVEEHNKNKRLSATKSMDTLLIQWNAGEEISPEPIGALGDKIISHIRSMEREEQLNAFESINRPAIRQFWAYEPAAGLEIKTEIEAKKRNFNSN
jgi:phage recombination protein Bet